jgi:hypothetical protein
MGRTLQPARGEWQLSHERPLLPWGTWKGFCRSTKPSVLNVAAAPAAFGTGRLFGSRGSPSKAWRAWETSAAWMASSSAPSTAHAVAPAASSAAAASVARPPVRTAIGTRW